MKLLLPGSDIIDIVKSIPMINEEIWGFRQQLVQFFLPHTLKFSEQVCVENMLHHDVETTGHERERKNIPKYCNL